MKEALLLINVGTPDAPEKKAVKRYLSEFLNDPYVIDLPFLSRFILVNGIIIPFRVKKSTGLYKQVWTEKGSPLLYHMQDLQKKLSNKVDTYIAMRYGKPALEAVLKEIQQKQYDKLHIFPMFPHFAQATTGTVLNKVEEIMGEWDRLPELNIVKQFYNHPMFIKAFLENIQPKPYNAADHVIFSYHGLPLRQINKVHPEFAEETCVCKEKMPEHGQYCYKATCYETTRIFMKALNLDPAKCTTSFQSRLTKNWLAPTTEEVIEQQIEAGCKKLLVVAPAFTTDCLETNVEIGVEYRELFLDNGGKEFHWVESLNSSDAWVEAILDIIKVG